MVNLICAVLLAVSPSDSLAAPASDAPKTEQTEQVAASLDSATQVRLALQCEARGLSAERAQHLTRAVLSDPGNVLAWGLMGLVSYQGRWETPEAVREKVKADEDLAARLAEYNRRRGELDDRPGDRVARAIASLEEKGQPLEALRVRREAERKLAPRHARLGLWCEQNGLKPEAVAHFTQAVVFDPGREATWRRLGYLRFDGSWMTPEQIAARKTELAAQRNADRHWRPLLTKWSAALKREDARASAEASLATVTDPRAVPAIMSVLAVGTEADQTIAARLLGAIDSTASTRALARLAVFGAPEPVRSDAIGALRAREPRDYAGLLIGQIRARMKTEVLKLVGGPGSSGALKIENRRFKMIRTYDAPPVIDLQRSFFGYVGHDVNGLPVIANGFEMRRLAREQPAVESADLARIEARTAGLLAEANLKAAISNQQLAADIDAVEAANAASAALNARIFLVLQDTLSAPELGDEPDDWNAWYYDTVLGYRYEPPPQVVAAVNASPSLPPPPRMYSCFAAGTPVRTLDGRRPIETLRVGDQVLSQDVSTGDLSFRPVVTVHHNAPAATIQIALDNGETLTASIYHRFWRAGRGWAMARELKPGDVLRTLGALVRVISTDPGPVVPVFNLDVASSRTFFVGAHDALVHDNTPPDPHLTPFDAPSKPDSQPPR